MSLSTISLSVLGSDLQEADFDKHVTLFSVEFPFKLHRYIYYWNLQFLNNVIIIKTKDPPRG
jgi:hypothetical protein